MKDSAPMLHCIKTKIRIEIHIVLGMDVRASGLWRHDVKPNIFAVALHWSRCKESLWKMLHYASLIVSDMHCRKNGQCFCEAIHFKEIDHVILNQPFQRALLDFPKSSLKFSLLEIKRNSTAEREHKFQRELEHEC